MAKIKHITDLISFLKNTLNQKTVSAVFVAHLTSIKAPRILCIMGYLQAGKRFNDKYIF